MAYNTLTPTNQGGQYRADKVSIENTTDAQVGTDPGGPFEVGHVQPGEWLNYTVNVTAAGSYVIGTRVASQTGGTFHYNLDGAAPTGPVTLPNTGGWQTWQTVSSNTVTLPAGTHVLQLFVDTAAVAGQDVGNFHYFTLTNTGVTLPAVTVAATTPTASETKPTSGVFTVTRTGATTSPLTVNFTTSGSAVAGTDYTAVGTSVVIPAGAASAAVTIAPVDDKKNDGTESAVMTLAAGSGYTLGAVSAATVSITDSATSTNGVTSFTLINADTGQPFPQYAQIPNGAAIDLATLGTQNLSIQANTNPATVGSVEFNLDGVTNFHTDNKAPTRCSGTSARRSPPGPPPTGSTR